MITYTSIDRIISIIERELGESNPFSEEDLIEWTGEAMEFLSVFPVLEEKVAVLNVKDYKASLPKGLVHIQQLVKPKTNTTVTEYIKEEVSEWIEDECDDTPIPCNTPSFSIKYSSFTKVCNKENGFEPIRLSNNQFFKTLVCKEPKYKELYSSSKEEYTIIGNTDREFLFSFKEGEVLLSYLSMAVDSNTGYPLIPDQPNFISAITYYIKWKVSEAMTWRGREGYSQLLQFARQEWLRYARQAKNWAKMPKTLEDWQTSLDSQYNLIPNLKKYAGTKS